MMAGNGDAAKGSMEVHVRTYDRMISMFKIGSVLVALIAALVIWLIS
jgi:uncharacterized protein involved in exopolysaccharide biosynthesis